MNLFNLDDLKNDYKNVNINVFLRCDLNITENDYSRIDLSIPTILELLELDSVKKLIICTHLGRPKNSFDPELSTKNKIKPYLEEKLRRPMHTMPLLVAYFFDCKYSENTFSEHFVIYQCFRCIIKHIYCFRRMT